MLHRLRRHPFPVRAHFDTSLVLTYALPRRYLEPFLYPGLELDLEDDLGFVAIALVRTKALRPEGFPAWAGQNFFLSGYRIFTRFTTPAGRRLRGLRILRSDTDSWLMVLLGNLMTHYRYHKVQVLQERSQNHLRLCVRSRDGWTDLDVTFDVNSEKLPQGTIFKDWRHARKYAGPLPFTFSFEKETQKMVVVQGQRQHWEPRGIEARVDKVSFFDQPAFHGANPLLVNAFMTENIPYRWERGELL